jgi:glycolate oxidase iron-sulfur subunit
VRRVGFFVGCATNLIYPESGRAVIDALARSGVEVVLPRDQGCCGTPVMNSGDFTTARELARTNIAAFAQAGVDAVVTACASCGLTLKSEYAEVLGLEDGLGIPVYDFAEFLTQRREPLSVPAASASRPTIRVAYHDPCHLVRGQGISREPREILKGLPWVEYVEMRDADRCCGGGGTFCLTHYDVARAIGGRKVEAIRDAGVDIVATECPSCVMQLRDMVEQAGLSVAVVALADVVAMGDGALDA